MASKDLLEITADRPEDLLNKRYEENMAHVKETGREPVDRYPHVGFGMAFDEADQIDEYDMEMQLELISSFQTLTLFVETKDEKGKNTSYVPQPIDVDLDFPSERTQELYQALDSEIGVNIAHPMIEGRAQDPITAYRNTEIGYSFDLEPDVLSVGLVYDETGYQINFTSFDNQEDHRRVLDTLDNEGIPYNGFYEDDGENEWIITPQKDTMDLDRRR